MGKIYCYNCGKYNQSSRSKCQFCNASLFGEVISDDSYNKKTKNNKKNNSNYTLNTYTTNSGYQIQSHSFEHAKNEIQRFSANSYTYTEFDEFETVGGFLYLGSHKVTGEEMNAYSEKVKECLQALNDIQIDTIEHFKDVYNAFEALDRDYIQGLILSVKSAEQAAEDAKTAGYDAQKALKETDKTVNDLATTQKKLTATTAALEKTILALSQFKSKLDKIEHLDDIDVIWDMINKSVKSSKAKKSNNNSDDEAIYQKIAELKEVTAKIDKAAEIWKSVKESQKTNSSKKSSVALFFSISSFILIIVYIALNFMGIL